MNYKKTTDTRIMMDCHLDSMKEYLQSTYYYFKNPTCVYEEEEIEWGLLAMLEYAENMENLLEEYEEAYEKEVYEKLGHQNENRNVKALFILEINFHKNLDRIQEYGQDALDLFMGYESFPMSKILKQLLLAKECADALYKILDEIMVIYETELESIYEYL